MRKIAAGTPPQCLTQSPLPWRTWDDFAQPGNACHSDTRTALVSLQDDHCAYCERRFDANTDDRRPHIEHLRPRSRNPHLMFAWANLLASCSAQRHCGHGKGGSDSRILDPRQHDPSAILELRPATGEIAVRDGTELCSRCRELGRTTIDVLNLNDTSLRVGRRNASKAWEWARGNPDAAAYLRDQDFGSLIASAWAHPANARPGQCPGH